MEPVPSNLFCNRCGTPMQPVGLPNGNRRRQNVCCQNFSQASQNWVSKWIHGQRVCTTCACSLSAAAKYVKCVDCRASETMNPLPTTPFTQRTCDRCANVLPSYEQSRQVCHSYRRQQLRQRAAAKADTPTVPPQPVEAFLGRAILPAPRKGSQTPFQPAPLQRWTGPIDSSFRSCSSSTPRS